MDTIPRVIHYCWFGKTPHPASVVRCMDSWRRVLPDYRIVEWNETNFDITSTDYTHEAYKAGRFAFVTDYVRLKALYDHGGIYMDTDVEVVKPLDSFLHHHAFTGFEDAANIPTAVMGSRAGNEWIRVLLEEYDGAHFTHPDGTHDFTTNVSRITRSTRDRFGISLDNSYQDVPNLFSIYPQEYFCAKSYGTGVVRRTKYTHTIHHFSGSWKPEEQRSRKAAQGRVNRLFGVRVGGLVLAMRNVYLSEGAAAIPKRVFRGLLRRVSCRRAKEHTPE